VAKKAVGGSDLVVVVQRGAKTIASIGVLSFEEASAEARVDVYEHDHLIRIAEIVAAFAETLEHAGLLARAHDLAQEAKIHLHKEEDGRPLSDIPF